MSRQWEYKMTRAVIMEEVEDLQTESGDKKWGVMNARNIESNEAQNFLGSQGWEAVQFTPPDKDGECTMLWKREIDTSAEEIKESIEIIEGCLKVLVSWVAEQHRKEKEDSPSSPPDENP